jgi:hypothetical protein
MNRKYGHDTKGVTGFLHGLRIAGNFRTSISQMGYLTSTFEHHSRGESDWSGSTYAKHVSESFTRGYDHRVRLR